jgi:GntR family transcriptional regulator
MVASYEDRRTPRYVQLIDYIQENITKGTWGPHHKVPSEEELAKQFLFARGTVRQAMTELVNAKVLYRIQGKGTFVGPKLIQHDVSTTGFRSFLDEFIDKNVSFETHQIDCVVIPAFSPIREYMHIDNPVERVARVRRLRVSGGEPFMYSENHIPIARYPGFEQLDFSHKGIYEILEQVYGLKFGHVQRYFQAVKAEGEAAKQLKVAPDSPLILTEQIVYDSEGRCTDYAYIWLRSDKIRISVNMDRNS